MLYYKIRENCDNFITYKHYENGKQTMRFVIGKELITPHEKEKYGIPDSWCTPVDVNPHNTYWFFGARFALK